MVLSQKYRKSPEHIVSYDYTDVITGLGYQIYYLNRTHTSGADGWYLTPNSLPADEATSWKKDTDGAVDFYTSEFNSPRILKGTVYLAVYQAANAKVTDIVLYKYDGTTSTQIAGSVESRTNPTNNYSIIKITLDKDTLIKKGEQLRLHIDGTAGADIEIGSTAGNFSAQIHFPFKILP